MSLIEPKNIDTNKFWIPQVGPQLEATLCPADELLFAGTRGGGKTHLAVGKQIIGALKYGYAWNGAIFRRKYKDHAVMRRSFDEIIRTTRLPAKRVGGDEQLTVYHFSNGATVSLHAIPEVKALEDFQGQQFQLIVLDEAPLLPYIGIAIDLLKGCLRSPHGVPCQMLLTGNPGGPGAGTIKAMYIPKSAGGMSPVEEGQVNYIRETLPDGRAFTRTRVFIRSRLQDNKYLWENNPGYVSSLMSINDPALRAAWLDGRWDVFVGQAFNFNERHIVKPIWPIPQEVPLYMTYDWGHGAPFSVIWWWVDADDRVYGFAEWYGCDPSNPSKGIRLTDKQQAEGIVQREKQMGIAGRPITRLCDPTCFNKKPDYMGGGQGPSTAEEFENYGNSVGYNLTLYPGDPNKKLKIRQFRNRLEVPSSDETMPALVVYNTLEHFIRIIPNLCVDELTQEGLAEGQELHPYDSACHICMARPHGADYVALQEEAQKQARVEVVQNLDNVSQMASHAIDQLKEKLTNQQNYDNIFYD
ncbi:MAG: Terminase-like family protein [Chloroflexi bacterium]|nr:MAG: Terminase-like family protein [Chloroflexota bacterium]